MWAYVNALNTLYVFDTSLLDTTVPKKNVVELGSAGEHVIKEHEHFFSVSPVN